MKVSDLISTRRKELGLTMEELGKIVGVGKGTIHKWETGDISNMRRDKIALLAKALHVSPIDLIDPQDELRDPLNVSHGSQLTPTQKEFIELLDAIPEDKQQMLLQMIKALVAGM